MENPAIGVEGARRLRIFSMALEKENQLWDN